MHSLFEIAAGSVAGSDHLRAARNSHDAFHSEITADAVVAVVCDGCGSAEHSEVGAKIGARLVARAIAAHLPAHELDEHFWGHVQLDVLARLAAIAEHVGTIEDYFLFTIVAAVASRETTTVAVAGDGLVLLNGERVSLPVVVDNAPSYLTYALRESGGAGLRTVATVPTAKVSTLLIASDGAEHLPSLGDFVSQDVIFRNPDAMRRRLFMLNRRPPGSLPDDTTIVAIRRRESHDRPPAS